MPNTTQQTPASPHRTVPLARRFRCSYQLRNGATGSQLILAASSCDAVIALADQMGERLQRASVRPV